MRNIDKISLSCLTEQSATRALMTEYYSKDESEVVNLVLSYLDLSQTQRNEMQTMAHQLVEKVRVNEQSSTGVEALMMRYDLSSAEGILLMCLAEALLRIPDKETENILLRDKIASADWEKYLSADDPALLNLASKGLHMAGMTLRKSTRGGNQLKSMWQNLLNKTGAPVIRVVVRKMMSALGDSFILGKTIESAWSRAQKKEGSKYRYSFDMLGEVAMTDADAQKYFAAYAHAIDVIAVHNSIDTVFQTPSISVKLSALYPRYEFAQQDLAVPALIKRLTQLAEKAMKANISLTVDAEEADRLDISLDIIEAVFCDPQFKNWEGLGLAVQAYQKRAFVLLDWLVELAEKQNKRMQVRLVKGAYWDTEIKLTQMQGLSSYPVFTRKESVDINYLACAKKMLAAQTTLYPQFASHNANTIAATLALMGDPSQFKFEFQVLQGMGGSLHEILVGENYAFPVRTYAPVGAHKELLPYLLRRLLENGANSSFVHQISDKNISIDDIIADPTTKISALADAEKMHPKIPLPRNLYLPERLNSPGVNLSNIQEVSQLLREMTSLNANKYAAKPLIADKKIERTGKAVLNPADHAQAIGEVVFSNEEDVELALQQAQRAFPRWSACSVDERALILENLADLCEENYAAIQRLIICEAGRTIRDSLSEVREAVDFFRYYAMLAREQLSEQELPGPTGESNHLRLSGRGTFLCISPWNFPVALFVGQIAAALVTGNTVIAKPAGPTPLVADYVVRLFHQAGVPEDVLQLLPGSGGTIGKLLVSDERIAGVLFTGSTATAKNIQQSLAKREGPIVPFVAETGGINVMIADSSTLLEQLTADVIESAFNSAGQRCSALRVLFLQEEMADDAINMLAGAMAKLRMGDPMRLSTDVGPVINAQAKEALLKHVIDMEENAKLIYRVPLSAEHENGNFVAPQAYELKNLSLLREEHFGPILHVIRYRRQDLDQVIEDINALGYGLTFGIHSRIDETIDHIQDRILAGNIYVNRNIVGAVVGVQPFGGSRASGTGPKAGGPHYLLRLCEEQTVTVNTAAVGGNAALLELKED